MRRTSAVVAVVVILAAFSTGCHRGESVTGPSTGSSMLSGEVVPVGDLAGAAASGINVSYSGQVATTDAAGRFVFTGLSATYERFSISANNRQMSFSRGDGINATANVTADATSVVVQLQKSQATVIVTGQVKELEGLITNVSDSSITVNNASTHRDETAAITGSTVIRKGNQNLKPSDLHVGDRVHVKTTGSADSLTATEIMLQQGSGSGSGTGQTKELEGPITKISDSSITVKNASTASDVTAKITGSTVIRKGNQKLTTKDLHVGDRVHVKTTGSADALTATEILLQNPAN